MKFLCTKQCDRKQGKLISESVSLWEKQGTSCYNMVWKQKKGINQVPCMFRSLPDISYHLLVGISPKYISSELLIHISHCMLDISTHILEAPQNCTHTSHLIFFFLLFLSPWMFTYLLYHSRQKSGGYSILFHFVHFTTSNQSLSLSISF